MHGLLQYGDCRRSRCGQVGAGSQISHKEVQSPFLYAFQEFVTLQIYTLAGSFLLNIWEFFMRFSLNNFVVWFLTHLSFVRQIYYKEAICQKLSFLFFEQLRVFSSINHVKGSSVSMSIAPSWCSPRGWSWMGRLSLLRFMTLTTR